ncbi:DUF2326 domain-containing protein [Leptospira bandrabouensis]|uniref:DUF2326 domain-containing protein n=1 Tax=Leptospira bandrabouensis TaxID=2484903 RepID=A0A6H3NRU4_9LEPT|nr:DUF2326 domain-containing protein [Leptospira bandrabouensis]TGN11610.1 DUF2326 domain-containing protein [Leptospira bandrabouensis]
MFLNFLRITADKEVIREIKFIKGLNLIIDETSSENDKETGNNVGKTTLLKLIDFCFGADQKAIYVDPESKKQEYTLVKNFLREKKILITLQLIENLEDAKSSTITLERNFASRNKIIRKINGKDYSEDEYSLKLKELLFPDHLAPKPTLRQIISHNIRYKEDAINNTLKTLDRYTTDVEYETLYLFLLGCNFIRGNEKQEIISKLKIENDFKSRLENNQSRITYETALSIINKDIEYLNERKKSFNLNLKFEVELDKLNETKSSIAKLSNQLSNMNIRKRLIEEAEKDLKANYSQADTKQLFQIYQQATDQVSKLHKTFEELLVYHNNMILEKIKFLKKDLPKLESDISNLRVKLSSLLKYEQELSDSIVKSESFDKFESILIELNEKFRKKGEYETTISQLISVEVNIDNLNKQLAEIDEELFSDSFEATVKSQKDKFNVFFTAVSRFVYGEEYALTYKKEINKKGQRIYKFTSFNTNLSSGKKQGEISCFDIAYILFAREENIPSLQFLLNDKKELMHDNQLNKIADFANLKNIQFVASILKDKLPIELNNDDNIIIKLSPTEKLFKIESFSL